MYKALDLSTIETRDDGHAWHVADPGVVIPATIARIQEVLASKWRWNLPVELVDQNEDNPEIVTRLIEACECSAGVPAKIRYAVNGADGYVGMLETIAVVHPDWDAALAPMAFSDEPTQEEAIARAARALALQLAWTWFKRALTEANGLKFAATYLHITKNLDYKE